MECLKYYTEKLQLKDKPEQTGRVSFMLLKGHDRVYQTVKLPLYITPGLGREYFAKWTPEFEFIDSSYLTDANGYNLMSREVFKSGTDQFSAAFFPVDTSITIRDFAKERSLTVWNDRPQAGSVQDDKSIKLLIDRFVKTVDDGGITEAMVPYRPKSTLDLHFSLRAYPTREEGTWLALR